MNFLGWRITISRSDVPPDTLRSGEPFEDQVLRRLTFIELAQLETTSALVQLREALIETGKTQKGHLDSHDRDARREHLRLAVTQSEET